MRMARPPPGRAAVRDIVMSTRALGTNETESERRPCDEAAHRNLWCPHGYASLAAEGNADGSTTVYFGPKLPDSVKRGNWIQTMRNKGWFVILRLYSPLEPFFTKEWRPSEIELVR